MTKPLHGTVAVDLMKKEAVMETGAAVSKQQHSSELTHPFFP
jgi:hypothetical protein